MVLERAIGQRADRDTVLALALGQPLHEAPARLAAFIEGLGVKTRFADCGVDDEQAVHMVNHAMTGARGRNFISTLSQEAA
jgi:alcohol dehydrogenase YqhD (iron-dependent ADH family)